MNESSTIEEDFENYCSELDKYVQWLIYYVVMFNAYLILRIIGDILEFAPFLTRTEWQSDPIVVTAVAVLGYLLIAIGTSFVKTVAFVRNNHSNVSYQQAVSALPSPLLFRTDRSLLLGKVVISLGVGLLFTSAIMYYFVLFG